MFIDSNSITIRLLNQDDDVMMMINGYVENMKLHTHTHTHERAVYMTKKNVIGIFPGSDECHCWPTQMTQIEIHILFKKNINF